MEEEGKVWLFSYGSNSAVQLRGKFMLYSQCENRCVLTGYTFIARVHNSRIKSYPAKVHGYKIQIINMCIIIHDIIILWLVGSGYFAIHQKDGVSLVTEPLPKMEYLYST